MGCWFAPLEQTHAVNDVASHAPPHRIRNYAEGEASFPPVDGLVLEASRLFLSFRTIRKVTRDRSDGISTTPVAPEVSQWSCVTRQCALLAPALYLYVMPSRLPLRTMYVPMHLSSREILGERERERCFCGFRVCPPVGQLERVRRENSAHVSNRRAEEKVLSVTEEKEQERERETNSLERQPGVIDRCINIWR